MNLERFTGPGSTPARRRFWDKIQTVVMASRKVEGRHVKIDEHPGEGSVINVDDTSTRRPTDGSPGACCYDDGTCDDLIESECTDAGGNWQGPGTACDDDPPPCVGVCCEDSGCVDDSTPDSCAGDGGRWIDFGTTCDDDPPPCATGACCADDGICSITSEADCVGTYQGDDTTCDPNPCPPPCNGCGYEGFIDSGTRFLTKTTTWHFTDALADPFPPCNSEFTYVWVETYDPATCEVTTVCSGGGHFDDSFGDHQVWTWEWSDILGLCHCVGDPCAQCAGGTSFGCCNWSKDTGMETPVTNTEADYDCSDSSGTGYTCTSDVTVVLSSPCIPEGFSPPP